ncbi:hypothetical protein FG386_003186 [Cryptosporidium ryanae]|uniref:uncharacterized protein n=1 Tax=Cryptosporidium ryanae TaxID=515981 RepID=UPI003519E299|nr:hypothetical protein FG386_003186 [Cryptosporidium ryanae]
MSNVDDTNEGKTVFLRNVPFEISENDLKILIETRFGEVEYVKIVLSRITQLPKGVAFVKFKNKNSVEEMLSNEKKANEYFENNVIGTKMNNRKDKKCMRTLLIPPDIGIQFNGRRIYAHLALSRNEIESIKSRKHTFKKNCTLVNDLELIKQGLILPGMKEAEGMSEHDLKLRENSWKELKFKINNPNYEINKLRLCIRNIPTNINQGKLGDIIFEKISNMGDDLVRKLVINIISELEEKELSEKNDFTEIRRILSRLRKSINSSKKSKSVLKGLVQKVRIIRKDSSKTSKSMGYGFIHTRSFFLSKEIMSILNNNPSIFSSEKRPIVEFAIEDKRALYLQKRKSELKKRLNKNSHDQLYEVIKKTKDKIGRGKRQRMKKAAL